MKTSNITLKIAPSGRLDAPQAARHLVQRSASYMRTLILSVLLFFTCVSARASEPLTNGGIVLLQPDFVLQERVPNVEAFAAYISAVEGAGRAALVESKQRSASGGFIVAAVRPGAKSKVWLDFKPPLPLELKASLISKIQSVSPFSARSGPVVFAIKASIWGGALRQDMPSPIECQAVSRKAGRPLEIGDLVERVWSE